MANIIKTDNKKFNWFQLGVIIVTLTAVFVAAFFFFRPHAAAPSQPNAVTPAAAASQKNYIAADEAAFNGDYAKGQAILDSALKSATNDSDRSDIYIQKSTLALNNVKNTDAVAFAKQAEQLHPTRITATALAQAAEQAGDKALALQYYKLVVARTTEQEKQLAPDDFTSYQAKVAELEKQ